LNEAFRNRVAMVLVGLVGDPVAPDEDAVLEHPGPHVGELDHVQLGELVQLARLRVLRLQDLRQLVVGHGGGSVDVPVQEQAHVERLVHDLDLPRRTREDAPHPPPGQHGATLPRVALVRQDRVAGHPE
jgi:hypothetical protein